MDDQRRRTRTLIAGLEPTLLLQHADPVLGPILWDLTHLAVYEDLWGVGAVLGREARVTDDALAGIYDAFEQPRCGRCALPLLPLEASLALQDAVRARTLEGLDRPGPDADRRLGIGGFVYRMLAEHEAQHIETMLQSLARFAVAPGGFEPGPAPVALAVGGPEPRDDRRCCFEAATVVVGRDTGGPFDNEFPAHAVSLSAFALDSLPVSNRRFLDFVEADGYRRRELWTAEGWAWRERERVELPLDWRRESNGSYWVRRFGQFSPLDPREPVQHVSAHEADAFARFAGGRLPTEFEWEHAARSAPQMGRQRPSGRRAGPDPLPLDAASGLSADNGPCALSGWVYEWTSSEFAGYPGFVAFPYREYSAVFFHSGYRVLRGCSWAAWPLLARGTYRNWDRPERRQLFAGLRLAWDL